MKEITFKELQDLVANIDYVFLDTFPVRISVENKNGFKRNIEFGITNEFKVSLEQFNKVERFNEYQYMAIRTKAMSRWHVVDVQDADEMEYNAIGEMLKEYGITNESKITLKDSSFSGRRKNIGDNIPQSFIAERKELITQANLTKEVEKGLNFFKELINRDIMLVSTKKDEVLDLNGMSGSTFSFIIDRKVLYYDELNKALCTYCPYSSKSDREWLTIRIETNDNFKWILLNECNGENLLSGTKPCNIKIKEPFKEERSINSINADKIKDTLQKALDETIKYVGSKK